MSLQPLNQLELCTRSERVRVWRRAHAKFPQRFRERIAKFPEFRRALRRKNCEHSASVRCEKYRNVAAALGEVGSLFRSEKVRVWRRDHAKSAQKFHETNANFPEFRRATRTEFVFFSASMRCTNRMTSPKLSTGFIVR